MPLPRNAWIGAPLAPVGRARSIRPAGRSCPTGSVLLVVGMVALLGCRTTSAPPADDGANHVQPAPTVTPTITEQPITLDGRLDEPVWRTATVLPLHVPGDEPTPREPGSVRFAVDDEHLYVGFDFTDRDIVQEATADHQHHYQTGDVAELFLKPADASYYWELYVTPNGLKTAFFYPGRGRLGLPSAINPDTGLRVAAVVDGTLNDWRDDDAGWTAEMAVPRAELDAAGVPFNGAHDWGVLVGRYNFGRHLPARELSSMPHLPRADFHNHAVYAPLQLP